MSESVSGNGESAEVNIVPLADVCLVLLIMLMILSPMVLQAMIQVQAAQAVATRSKAAAGEKPIFVDITKEGFTVNSKPVPSEYELFRTLQRNIAAKDDKTVLISAAREVRYQDIIRVLDIVKQSGAVSLSLVPRRDQAPAAAEKKS